MRHKDRQTAERYGFLSRAQAFEKSLLEIEGITGDHVDFDLDGWWSNIRQVIIVPRYSIPAQDGNYFTKRRELIQNVIDVAAKFGLTRTEDSIEDCGEHLYFVFQCNDTWP